MVAHIEAGQAEDLEALTKDRLVGFSRNQLELDKMLDEATDLGDKGAVAIPDCRSEVSARERDERTKFKEKSLRLTDARTGLW